MKKRNGLFLLFSIIWMVIIFLFSAREADLSQEDSHTIGRMIGKITQNDFENWTDEEQLAFAEKVDHPIRKSAHAMEYAILGILLFAAIEGMFSTKRAAWDAWGYATIYAATDEFHQLFVPGRSGQVSDVILDSVGALCGVAFIVLVIYFKKKKNKMGE